MEHIETPPVGHQISLETLKDDAGEDLQYPAYQIKTELFKHSSGSQIHFLEPCLSPEALNSLQPSITENSIEIPLIVVLLNHEREKPHPFILGIERGFGSKGS